MAVSYTIHATRKGVSNRIPCSSATMALTESRRLKKQGWRVIVLNSLSITMTDHGLDRLMKVEAVSSSPLDRSN